LSKCDVVLVRLMLERGADPNLLSSQYSHKITSLHFCGNREMLSLVAQYCNDSTLIMELLHRIKRSADSDVLQNLLHWRHRRSYLLMLDGCERVLDSPSAFSIQLQSSCERYLFDELMRIEICEYFAPNIEPAVELDEETLESDEDEEELDNVVFLENITPSKKRHSDIFVIRRLNSFSLMPKFEEAVPFLQKILSDLKKSEIEVEIERQMQIIPFNEYAMSASSISIDGKAKNPKIDIIASCNQRIPSNRKERTSMRNQAHRRRAHHLVQPGKYSRDSKLRF